MSTASSLPIPMSDSSLTTDSPSIDMDNKHNLNLLTATPNIATATSNLFAMNNFDDLLFNTPTTTTTATDNAVANQMDFLMMDFTQQTSSSSAQIGANINITSPVLDFQNTINITPSAQIGANINITSPVLDFQNTINLTSGLLEMGSNPNTPHLPPLNIEDANSQQTDLYPTIPTMPSMPIVNGIGDNIPPPTHDLDWQTFCNLINHNNNSNNSNSNSNNCSNNNSSDNYKDKKRKNNDSSSSPLKKRKLNNTKKENIEIPKKKKRGRPRKNPQKVNIKKEKKDKKIKKNKKNNKGGSDDEYDMEEYLKNSYAAESFVGIRTEDGEVRIQIPPNSKSDDDSSFNNNKVKFTVFGNACSDKIEDILQPKKRTRYVRGLSEEEKKTRRREQNRNAAARSRARKNAMISKVIQLHQENMGLRAFVAENITQTKILRDEINRLNAIIILNQQQQQQQQPQQPTQSSLFDIINQDSSTLFQSK